MSNYKKERFKFQKGYTTHKYGDPTYLTFFMLFDWGGSPLFNGKAEQFLREVLVEPERADSLVRFTQLLQKLNKEMPWYFYELEGFENIFKFDEFKEAYRGTDDGLKIKCTETLDLSIAGLMDMYRNIAYDINRWCRVLPSNLTYFNMFIIVSDARNIANKKLNTTKTQTSDFVKQDREYTVVNKDIAYTARAHFMVGLKKCSFKTDSGVAIFSGLSQVEPKMAENEIGINYQIVKYYSKQYLNEFEGIMGANKIHEYHTSNQNSNGETESSGATSEGDKVSGKEQSETQVNGDTRTITKPGKNIERIQGYGESTNTENPIAPNVPNTLAENLLEDAIAALEGGAERLTQDAFAKLLLGNVYGLNAASNIQDAISAGSLNAIRNLATKTIDAVSKAENSVSNGKVGIGDNVFPNVTPEQDSDLGNIFPKTSPEKDSDLGNING